MRPYAPPSLRAYPPRAGEVCATVEDYIVKLGYAPTRRDVGYIAQLFDKEIDAYVDIGLFVDVEGGKINLTEAGAACAALEKERKTS